MLVVVLVIAVAIVVALVTLEETKYRRATTKFEVMFEHFKKCSFRGGKGQVGGGGGSGSVST